MATSRITVLEGGFSTTIQDAGRPSSRRWGVPPGGILDHFAYTSANRLVQNPAGAAVLEIMIPGPILQFETSALVAITGAISKVALSDGRIIPAWMSFFVRAGQSLTFQQNPPTLQNWGRYAYLAIHGGLEAPLLMGSRSTYLRANLGGYRGEGRALVVGDILESQAHIINYLAGQAGHFVPFHQRPAYNSQVRLQVIPGPYLENFATTALPTLLSSSYTLTAESDRMGFRFEGAPLPHLTPELSEIASCATVFGAIQVPPNQQPIILMADHQVTGGYPIIATVVSRDLPLLAQLLPSATATFYV
jgi:antagonist of KipI